jgi:L-seryl-tRNA(Ser) seleniumtransferase
MAIADRVGMGTAAVAAADQQRPGAGGGDIYADLGVRTFINATGHTTANGGSIMPPEVVAAMAQASTRYVSLADLHAAAGQRIATAIGAPAAVVSSGAAGGILLGTAAILAGTDPQKILYLPETPPDSKNQVLVWGPLAPNYMYQAVRAAGGHLVEVGGGPAVDPDAFGAAIGPRTAAVLLVLAYTDHAREANGGWERVIGGVCRQANAAGVPVLVDAASELPPRGLIRQLLGMGATGVIVSGGKAIRGPQASGILAGPPELIAAAVRNNNPNTSVGRSLKVGKEEICGLVVAVERFFSMDEAAQLAEWHGWAQTIVDAARQRGARAEVVAGHPDYGRPPIAPKAVIRCESPAAAEALLERLAGGEPGVRAQRRDDAVLIHTMVLLDGQAEVVARRVRESLGM